MSSSWGRINSSKHIGRGIREVYCEGHGGILISDNAMETQPFLENVKDYALLNNFRSDRGGFEFEEDCEASIIALAMGEELYQHVWGIPDARLEQHWINVNRSVIMWNPNVFTHITGIGLSIFDSPKLLEQHLVECGHEVYKFNWSYRPSDYELPDGKRIFSVYEMAEITKVKHFMVSTDEFEQISRFKHLPVDTLNLQEVEAPQRKALVA